VIETGPSERASSEGLAQPARRPLAAPVRLLDWVVRVAVVIALGMVLVFTVGQVADRYILKSSFSGNDQFARIGLVWLTFLGIAVGIRDRTNIRIELLNHLAPRNVRRALSLVVDIVILVVSILLVIVGVRLLDIGSFHAIMGTDLNYDTMYAALLVGMGLLILFLVLRFANFFCGGRLNIDAPVIDDDHHN
jgi:TRAP-type C4-dicarboxylate transport system permease small subunit